MSETWPVTPHDWTARLAGAAMPVQRATREAIEHCRAQPEKVDANMLADIVLRDPLMCLRLLVDVAHHFEGRLATQTETVTAALVLLGIEPFFRDFADLPVLEDHLANQPAALAGALGAIRRAYCGARLAAGIALHCHDEDAELLHQAALLDDFPGLLLWCEAPEWAMQIAQRQQDNPALHPVDVQRDVLGVEFEVLGHKLMEHWGLPPTLRQLGQGERHGAHTVKLAVQIARHLQCGWDNPALPDDFCELGQGLHLPPAQAAALVRHLLD